MRELIIERAREAIVAARDGKPMPLLSQPVTMDPAVRTDPHFTIGYLVGTIEDLIRELELAGGES